MQVKTVIMTGATSGIGEAAAIAFARKGARVLAVGRDPERGAAVAVAMAQAGYPGDFIAANLLSLSDVRRLADEILARCNSVDVLFNNAGGPFPARTVSADGIEATFALNTVAPFALANHLHAALAKAKGRVVNTATGFLERTRLRVDELVKPPSYFGLGRYPLTKLAVIMVTLGQAERWKGDGIRAISVQPGIVAGTRFGGGRPAPPSPCARSGSPCWDGWASGPRSSRPPNATRSAPLATCRAAPILPGAGSCLFRARRRMLKPAGLYGNCWRG